MELQMLKDYIRVDHDLDDNLITMLQETAQAYIKGAVETIDESDKRYHFATSLLVGHWYENRLASSEAALNEIPFGVVPLIQQLRGAAL